MVFDASIAMTWVLYLALIPISFFWLRRAWRIVVRRDFSEVATRRGVAPPNAANFALAEAAINLIAGTITATVVVAVAAGALDYQTWTAIAGSALWCKLVASFIVSRHAHNALAKRAGR